MLLEKEHQKNEVKESYSAKELAIRERCDGFHCSECEKNDHKITTCQELNLELASQHL